MTRALQDSAFSEYLSIDYFQGLYYLVLWAAHSLIIFINLAKRGYCHASLCLSLCVYLCVRNPVSRHNFFKCELIVTKLYMEVAGNDTCIEKYNENRSKVNVKVTKIVKNTIVDNSGTIHGVMTNLLTSWRVFDVMNYFDIMTYVWCNDVFLTLWRTHPRHDKLFDFMTCFWLDDVIAYFWRHDELFWCHDKLCDVMT